MRHVKIDKKTKTFATLFDKGLKFISLFCALVADFRPSILPESSTGAGSKAVPIDLLVAEQLTIKI